MIFRSKKVQKFIFINTISLVNIAREAGGQILKTKLTKITILLTVNRSVFVHSKTTLLFSLHIILIYRNTSLITVCVCVSFFRIFYITHLVGHEAQIFILSILIGSKFLFLWAEKKTTTTII